MKIEYNTRTRMINVSDNECHFAAGVDHRLPIKVSHHFKTINNNTQDGNHHI